MVERIHRAVGYGFFQYVQEVQKKFVSTERVPVYIHEPVVMPDGRGQKLNYLV